MYFLYQTKQQYFTTDSIKRYFAASRFCEILTKEDKSIFKPEHMHQKY